MTSNSIIGNHRKNEEKSEQLRSSTKKNTTISKKTLLSCKEIIKIFPRKNTSYNIAPLQGLDLDVYSREVIGIFGPSGSGKTTLLQIIAGFESPTSGHVIFNGKDISALPPRQKLAWRHQNIGYFLQQFRSMLFPRLTIEENVMIKASIHELDSEETKRRMDFLLHHFDLELRKTLTVRNLSGGEQQRLALILSLINKPTLLLIDEPTSELDFEHATVTLEYLREFIKNNEKETAAIVTSHDPKLQTFFDRYFYLKKGRLVMVDE